MQKKTKKMYTFISKFININPNYDEIYANKSEIKQSLNLIIKLI